MAEVTGTKVSRPVPDMMDPLVKAAVHGKPFKFEGNSDVVQCFLDGLIGPENYRFVTIQKKHGVRFELFVTANVSETWRIRGNVVPTSIARALNAKVTVHEHVRHEVGDDVLLLTKDMDGATTYLNRVLGWGSYNLETIKRKGTKYVLRIYGDAVGVWQSLSDKNRDLVKTLLGKQVRVYTR